MRRLLSRFAVASAVCLAGLWAEQTATASIIQVGGTFTVAGTNFVTNYSQTATVGTPTLVDSGQVLLSETINPTSPKGEWVDFVFSTVNGGPLAGNINAYWDASLTHVPVTQAALLDGIFLYWTVNGTAVNPIFPFGGGALSNVAPNPINPALGPAYVASFPPAGPFTSFDFAPFVFVSPYSFVSAGGIDPNTANGLHLGIHLTPAAAAVPEPSSLTLLGLGSLGLLGFIRRRRRAAA